MMCPRVLLGLCFVVATATAQAQPLPPPPTTSRIPPPAPPVASEPTPAPEEEAGNRVLDLNADFERGTRRAQRGDISGAIRSFKAIVAQAPFWSDPAFNVGSLSESIAQWSDCALYLRRYLLLEPEEPDTASIHERIANCERRIVDSAQLSVQSINVPEARIQVGDLELGVGEVGPLRLPAGEWRVRVERLEYETFETTVTLTPGAVETVRAELVAMTFYGNIAVDVNVPGANISIDGLSVGVAPLTEEIRRPVGRYLLQVEAPGYHPWQRYVNVVRAETTANDVRLIDSSVNLQRRR